jgi:hypothetical protein
MGGLLDFNMDPQTMGLLGASAGMLQASGPSRMPISIMQAIGQGMAGGLQGYGQGIQLQRQQQQMGLLEQQIAIAKLRAAKEAQMQDMNMQVQRQIFGGGPAMGGAPSDGGGAPAPMSASRMPVQQGPIGSPMPESSDGEMFGGRAPVPAQQPAQQGGGFLTRASPEALMWLEANGYKGALEAAKYARQGVSFDPGKTYQLPNGQTFTVPILDKGMIAGPDGRVSLMPGFSAANAQVEGDRTFATERAKAGFNTAMIPTRDGGSVPAFQVFNGGGFGGGFGGQPTLGAQTPSDARYQTERAEASAKTMASIQDAGRSAGGQIANLRQIDRLLADHDGGNLSPLGMEIASAANSVGVTLDRKLANKEAAVNLSREMALQIINDGETTMKGALSDGDRKFAMSLPPGIENSREGRKLIVQARTAMLQRKQDVAEMARVWESNLGRIDARDRNGLSFEDVMRKFGEANPLYAGMKIPGQK